MLTFIIQIYIYNTKTFVSSGIQHEYFSGKVCSVV